VSLAGLVVTVDVMEHLGLRFRAYPDPAQLVLLARHAGACRVAWNLALEQRQTALERWQRAGRPSGGFVWPSYARQCAELRELRDDPEVAPWLKETPMQVLQQSLRDLDRAWGHWVCGKVGMPRFKKRSGELRICDPQHVWVRRASKRFGVVKIQGVGRVRIRLHRPFSGTVKRATVIREADGHWFIALTVRRRTHEVAPNSKPAVGVDLGVVVPVATSDGALIGQGLQTLRPKELERLLRLQRQLARCQRGSRNRGKVLLRINRLKGRQRRRRRDFVEQVSADLTKSHGLIAFEALQTRSMTRAARGTVDSPGSKVRQKAGLNRSILDRSWGRLQTRTEQKAGKAGAVVVYVPTAYSSQECPVCHAIDAASRVSQSSFVCTSCGHAGHADVNAAIVILERVSQMYAGGTPVAACQGTQPGRRTAAAEPHGYGGRGSRNQRREQGPSTLRYLAEASTSGPR
jgi:putative transposase